jgi:hypothetical protein
MESPEHDTGDDVARGGQDPREDTGEREVYEPPHINSLGGIHRGTRLGGSL